MHLALLLALVAAPTEKNAQCIEPDESHQPFEVAIGSGMNGPSALFGLEAVVRPVRRWSVALAWGGAPSSTNPDVNPFRAFACAFGGCYPSDDVRHIAPVPFRLTASTAYHHPINHGAELLLRLGVERNPGAIRTAYECPDGDCGEVDYIAVERITPTTWLGLASVGIAFPVQEGVFFRFETGTVYRLHEELSPTETREVDRNSVPRWYTFNVWLGWRFG